MKSITLENIEKHVNATAKKLGLCIKFNVTYDCGNAYINVNGSLNAITSVIFDEEGNLSSVYTMQYKEEILNDNEEPTGEFEDVENELYMGNSLTTALNKLRLTA
jgi:phosphoribosylformylglycinamidine (FGAM) synthase-like amidotransferase family enzyme